MKRRFLHYFTRRQPDTHHDSVEIIRQYFHTDFYLSSYPTVSASHINPIDHYIVEGWKLGYDPCPWFSSSSYVEMHPDVAEEHLNPFVHYLSYGHIEGRAICPSKSPAAEHFPQSPPPEFGVPSIQKQVVAREFDAAFYRASFPDVSDFTDEQLIKHYDEYGWKERRDPCAWFSTDYYLTRYGDIREGGINPFIHYLMHGRREGRLPNHYCKFKRFFGPKPRVSAIVPSFNHGRFLERRIKSIVEQQFPPSELIIIDDASTDNSQDEIRRITAGLDIPVTVVVNEINSGNVFRVWEKGISVASGDLLWICESDDFCNLDFLAVLAPYFTDPSVMIAFGAIQFADAEGTFLPGLDGLRESAAKGYWDEPRIESANTWFNGPFGVRNVIANVGGCLIRRQPIEPSIWSEAQSYSVCGDWHLYMRLVRGGRIAFDPRAVAYFSQHSANTSVSHFKNPSFYNEHFRIALEARRLYGTSDAQVCNFYRIVRTEYLAHCAERGQKVLHEVFNLNLVIDQSRQQRHILIVMLGFYTGGGEIFPINLANALVERGYTVSVMVLMTEGENPEVRGRLSSKVAVYERQLVDEIGLATFFETHGIDLVHTHEASADIHIHAAVAPLALPYVVTHHGSYEITEIGLDTLRSIVGAVSHWVYIADKNLVGFRDLDMDPSTITKLPNAVPIDDTDFPYTRESLGIEKDAFVFGLASRALKSKGWEIAIKALALIRPGSKRPIYLAICGDGPDYDELCQLYNEADGVKFLGYHTEIMSFYKLCDCCILPTRFPGESYPLTIIEAILVDCPVIATEIGEIKSMIERDGVSAGIVVPNSEDDETFIAFVVAAMRRMLDNEQRAIFTEGARKVAETYDFDKLVSHYESIYNMAAKSKNHGECLTVA